MCSGTFIKRKDFAGIQILFIYENCRRTDRRHGSSHRTFWSKIDPNSLLNINTNTLENSLYLYYNVRPILKITKPNQPIKRGSLQLQVTQSNNISDKSLIHKHVKYITKPIFSFCIYSYWSTYKCPTFNALTHKVPNFDLSNRNSKKKLFTKYT